MNRPIYCLIVLGLLCSALATPRAGLRAIASRDAAEEAPKLITEEQNSLVTHENEGYESDNNVLNFQPEMAPIEVDLGPPSRSENVVSALSTRQRDLLVRHRRQANESSTTGSSAATNTTSSSSSSGDTSASTEPSTTKSTPISSSPTTGDSNENSEAKEKVGNTEDKPNAKHPSAEDAGGDGESITDIRWIIYLFLLTIALLFLLLVAVVLLLAYYILSTRVLNKTTCKEIELQCRCDDCDKDDDGC